MQQKLKDVSKEKESTIQELQQKLACEHEQMRKEESSQQIAQLKEQVRKPFHRLHCICLIIFINRLKRKVIWQFKLVQI